MDRTVLAAARKHRAIIVGRETQGCQHSEQVMAHLLLRLYVRG